MESHTRLFVGNLPDNSSENDLRTAFSCYGDIKALDLKCKSTDEENKKNFAFISLSGSNNEIESCIKHFSSVDFNGKRLYVTRARESFLERLQREREQAKNTQGKTDHHDKAHTKNPVIKLGDKLNPRKRKIDHNVSNEIGHNRFEHKVHKITHKKEPSPEIAELPPMAMANGIKKDVPSFSEANKKNESEIKRMESMKKKRQEFKQKQMIIKTGLIGIDKVQNKKVIFSDFEDTVKTKSHDINNHKQTNSGKDNNKKRNTLFDEDDSGDEVNFEIKRQFEGAKGQKVLDLQSRYKSDKRFVLDERFIEDQVDGEKEENTNLEDDNIELGQTDEKAKQMNILQDVLGVAIRTNFGEHANNKKTKTKLGMLRFDPSQPEHAKFFAPVEEKQEPTKNSKKKKSKDKPVEEARPEVVEEGPKVEVSKEQFYTVSEALKEAIVQPTAFSLRSLFGAQDEGTARDESTEQDTGFIPLMKPKEPKVKNPLQPGEKNPFVYDSSDSESEDEKEKETIKEPEVDNAEVKAVWKENLFFSKDDYRFKEGLSFFNKVNEDGQKERRELKSLMKKRIYNKERKNQMFQKKIGGKKKTMKKSFRKKR